MNHFLVHSIIQYNLSSGLGAIIDSAHFCLSIKGGSYFILYVYDICRLIMHNDLFWKLEIMMIVLQEPKLSSSYGHQTHI